MDIDLDKELHRLRSDEIDWDEFLRRTRPAWERLAGKLTSRWGREVEHVVGNDDVVQELMLGAWSSLSQWDPKRGPTLKKYVVWNAMSVAKRKIHKARGASLHGSADRNPSRVAIGESRLPEGLLERAATSEPEQESTIRARDAVATGRNQFERRAVKELLTTGDVVRAVEALRGKQGRRALRLKNKTAAKHAVRDAAERALRAL